MTEKRYHSKLSSDGKIRIPQELLNKLNLATHEEVAISYDKRRILMEFINRKCAFCGGYHITTELNEMPVLWYN